jgi:hypothetical protein
MLRRVLVAGPALAILVAFAFVSQPSAAVTCAVLTEGAIGLKQIDAAERARRQLKGKINRWAAKNGVKHVRIIKQTLGCTQKGTIARCAATAKVCG